MDLIQRLRPLKMKPPAAHSLVLVPVIPAIHKSPKATHRKRPRKSSLSTMSEAVFAQNSSHDDRCRSAGDFEPRLDVELQSELGASPALLPVAVKTEECQSDSKICTALPTHCADLPVPEIWCRRCQLWNDEPCFLHFNIINDTIPVPLAYSSVPSQLCIHHRKDSNEEGVFAAVDVPPWTIFGPMVASQKLLRTDCEYAVNLSTHDSLWTSETSRVLDLESDDLCNWMKFVRFAHSAEDQNMVSSMQNGQIFFTSTKCIDAGRELKVWYSKKYSNSLGRPEHPGTFFAQKDGAWGVLNPKRHEERNFIAALEPSVVYNGPLVQCADALSASLPSALDDTVKENEPGGDASPEEPSAAKKKRTKSQKEARDRKGSGATTGKKERKRKNCVESRLERSNETKLRKDKEVTRKKMQKLLKKPTLQVIPAFQCTECPKEFRNVDVRNLHLLRHKDQSPEVGHHQSLSCPDCAAVFQTLQDLIDHVDAHGRKARHMCNRCRKSFVSMQRLELHINRLHVMKEEEKPFECEQCKKRFTVRSTWARHMLMHDGNIIKCPVCAEGFSSSMLAKAHCIEKHVQDGKFHCQADPSCTSTYPLTSFRGFRVHVQRHFEKTQHECQMCHKIFTRFGKLTAHLKRVHSNERKYACKSCDKTFKCSSNLGQHTKVFHNPDKVDKRKLRKENKGKREKKENAYVPPQRLKDYTEFVYRCEECQMGFCRRGMLVYHFEVKHPERSVDTVPELALPMPVGYVAPESS